MDQEKALKALVKACAQMSPELAEMAQELWKEENPPQETKEGEESKPEEPSNQ